MSAAADTAPPRTEPILSRQRRIRMVDTDAARLIYFGAVYSWAEALFTDWLAGLGRPLTSVLEAGIGLPAVRSEAHYLHPLGLDDEVELQLRANHVGEHSFSLLTTVYRIPDHCESVQVRIWHAYVELRPRAGTSTPQVRTVELPDWLREGLR